MQTLTYMQTLNKAQILYTLYVAWDSGFQKAGACWNTLDHAS